MPIEAGDMAQAKAFDRLRLLLIGKEKSGKSRTAATARKPVLFLDTDQRREAVAGIPGVYALTFVNPVGAGMQPSVYTDVLETCSRIEKSKKLKDIHPSFSSSADAEKDVQTVVLDSAATLSKACLDYAMYTNPKDLARKINLPSGPLHFPAGWDTWNADMSMMYQILLRFMAIPNLDVIMIFHEQSENGQISVFPGRHQQLVKYFNEVWRIQRDTQIPKAVLVPTHEFIAATNLIGAPAVVENPNIESLISQFGR